MAMTSTVSQPISDKAEAAVRRSREWAEGWFNLADFLENNPDIAGHAGAASGAALLCSITALTDPVAFLTAAAAKAVEAGVEVKPYQDRSHGGIHIFFGPAMIDIHALARDVFARQVVGQIDDVQYAPLFSIPSQGGEKNGE